MKKKKSREIDILKSKLRQQDKKIAELETALQEAETAKQIIAQTNRLLDEQLYKSTIVTKVGEIASHISDYPKMARALLGLSGQLVNFDAAVLLLARGEDKRLSFYINKPASREFMGEIGMRSLEIYNEKTNNSLTLDRFTEEIVYGEVAAKIQGKAKEELNTYSAAALGVGGDIFGVIAIGSRKAKAFAKGETESFNLIATQAAVIIDDAIRYKDLKIAHEQLKVIDDMKSDFISHVSHELRTPLATMQEANAQLLEGLHGPLAEGQRKYLVISQKSVERLTRIIHNLLDLSRLDAGKVTLDRKSVDITELAREAISSLKPQADKKQITLEDKLPPSLPKIFLDPDRIRQIFINLVGNSIKYTNEGGKITLTAAEKEGGLEASVSDTGIGIPQEYLDKIFDRFERVSKIPIPGVGGAGLGLSICKELIGMHKGQIKVESKVGAGSRFTVSLPIYNEEDYLRDYLEEQIKEAKSRNFFLSLVMINIENFDQIKGRQVVAEEFYRQLEDVIVKFIRSPQDKIFRYRDDTLAIVLVGTPREDGHIVVERLERAIMDSAFKVKDEAVKLSLRFKKVNYPLDGRTKEELILAAGG